MVVLTCIFYGSFSSFYDNLRSFKTMTHLTFFIYFFIIPIALGFVLSKFIIIDHPEIKEFKVNMGLNWTIFCLIVIGIVYVALHKQRSILDDWVTLGGFLAIATTNLSLGMALKLKKQKIDTQNNDKQP